MTPAARTARSSTVLAPPTIRDRVAEAIPASASWIFLLAPVWLTLAHPMAGIAFALLCTALFVGKVGYYGINALINRRRLLAAAEVDWSARLAAKPAWRDHRVIVMYRAFREGNRDMLEASLQSIVDSQWPTAADLHRQVEVVYATEEGDAITPPIVDSLAEQFEGRLRVRQIPHPKEPHVLPGPSSAMHWVGKSLFAEELAKGANPERILVADFDSDTVMHPAYLACLLSTFVEDPNRQQRAYQPTVLFTLDYWNAPIHSRLAGLGTSALTVGWNRSPEIAFTGAAASMHALNNVDWWPTLSHSQDSGVELRFRMEHGDAFTVTGLPVVNTVYPVMMVDRERVGWLRAFAQSFRVLFRQSARWREGPLDEFLESVRRGSVWFSVQKLWSGIERDTLTILPGYGYLVSKAIIGASYPGYDLTRLEAALGVVLTATTVIGLLVSWSLMSHRLFVPEGAPVWRRLVELGAFYMLMPFLLPVITGMAGLKTSTAYAFGRKPTGAYLPTPK